MVARGACRGCGLLPAQPPLASLLPPNRSGETHNVITRCRHCSTLAGECRGPTLNRPPVLCGWAEGHVRGAARMTVIDPSESLQGALCGTRRRGAVPVPAASKFPNDGVDWHCERVRDVHLVASESSLKRSCTGVLVRRMRRREIESNRWRPLKPPDILAAQTCKAP